MKNMGPALCHRAMSLYVIWICWDGIYEGMTLTRRTELRGYRNRIMNHESFVDDLVLTAYGMTCLVLRITECKVFWYD